MTAPTMADKVRAALVVVVDRHSAREVCEYVGDTGRPVPITICGECGNDVEDGPCGMVELIADTLEVDLAGIPPGHETAVIRLALDVMDL